MAVRIVTDSASDLPQDICDELGIEVVPLTIRFGDAEYVDRKELSTDRLLAQARSVVGAARDRRALGRCVRGDLPPPRRRRRRRHRLHQPLGVAVGDDAVGAGRGEGARRAVPDRDRRLEERVDGDRQPRAARRRRARPKAPTSTTIVREVEERVGRQHVLAALDTLEYLRKGGRIGGAKAMLGSMLSIKPIISVTDGAVDEAGKVRTRSKALRFIVDRLPQGPVERIAVLHAGAPDIDEFLDDAPRASVGAPTSSSATSARSSACTPARGCSASRWIEAG